MIPAQFEYYRPNSLDQAIALLGEHGDRAKLLAGGHSLIPLMKLRLARPEILIDIGRLPGLREIRQQDGVIAIGALCTHAQVADSPILHEAAPVLSETASRIGDPQVRNMGTIGGSIAHADPAADLPAVILALEAELIATGRSGPRTIPATEFFQGMLTTALRPDEILTELRVRPLERGTGSAYLKLENRASRYAVVGVAAVLRLSDGTCNAARIGVTGAGAVPVRATAAEQQLVGQRIDDTTIATAADAVPQSVDVIGDIHASAEYRTEMLKVYARRAIAAAAAAVR